MEKDNFISAMEQIATLGNKSVTVSMQDFVKLIEYAKTDKFKDNTKLRQTVIGQDGYGTDGCKLCGSSWMRRPYTEKTDHKKDCPAYPSF
jgi:cbb3-type cytochrome oxidase cytochrome c subunit